MGMFDMFKGGSANADEISFTDLVDAMKAKAVTLIDVREANEFAAGHVEGAQNRPLSSFDASRLPTERPVILMCKAGGRSAQALAKARAAGREDVRHYKGGALGWAEAGGKLV